MARPVPPRPWFALLLLALAPSTGAAQTALGIEEAPTRSVYQPGVGVADGAEPWGVVVNPGSLGELRGLTLGLRHTETVPDSRWTGRGTGFYVAAPVPYLGRLQIAGALELLRPPAGVPLGLSGKLTLGLSYRVLDFLSLGLSYAHLFAPYDGLDTLDLGLRLRLGRWFAGGVVLHDVTAPRPGAPQTAPLQRVYELELLGRPLADDRLELAVGARLGEQRGDLEPRARLWVRPIAGLGLGAEATVLLTPDGKGPDWRVGLGLGLDFAQFGGSAFGLFGSAPAGGGATGNGGSLGLRASMERYPALWEGGPCLYRFEAGKLSGVAFLEMLASLRRIESERRIRGVILVLGDLHTGWGRAEELREELLRLRRAGKHVYVYAADLTTRGYYVASAAEEIFLDPAGSVRVSGISMSRWFVKDALDQLGIRADLLRIGDYKSTPETFTRSAPSRPASEQGEAVVEDLYRRLVAALAAGRRMQEQRVSELIERGLFTPEGARSAGLVDRVATGEEVEEALQAELGQSLQIVAPESGERRHRAWVRPAIAVVNVEGDLIDGRSRTVPFLDIKFLGGETLLQEIEEAARDPQVEAIVLRVESPGGSATAADLVARLVAQARRYKPVICSLGDVAASGGYYLAAPCDLIFTDAMTVTGSIGIFGGKVDASQLAERLGVRSLPLVRGQHADMENNFRPYTEVERALVMEQIQSSYERFLGVVAAGRRMKREQVDAVGQGRIWTGNQAIGKKLCDRQGGLMDAVAEARRRAHLGEKEDVELLFSPRPEPTLLQRLLGAMGLPLPAASGATLPGLGRLQDVLFHLAAGLLLVYGDDGKPVLARMEGGVPR